MSLLHPFIERKDRIAAPLPAAPAIEPIEVPKQVSWDKVTVMPMDRGLGRTSMVAVGQYGAQEFHDMLGLPMDEARLKAHDLGMKLLDLGIKAGDALDTNLHADLRAQHNEKTPTQIALETSGISGPDAAVTIVSLAKLATEKHDSLDGGIAYAMVHDIGERLVAAEAVKIQLDAHRIAA